MRVVTIEEIVQEASHTKTYFFRAPMEPLPAQFVMAWIPGVDEVPMALSYIGERKGITVQALGDSTATMHHRIQVGARIGIRGPLGNTFDMSGGKYLIVSGGTGTASVITVAESLAAMGKEVTMVIGARTRDQFIFVDRSKKCSDVHLSTDDGSLGFHGYAPSLAEDLLGKGGFDRVITCGPEKMMKKVVELTLARDLPVEVSLERYMKCGIGICDACVFNGYLVCVDGPVFDGRTAMEVGDFARWRRDQCGRRIPM
jgi:dihydroorotate dehydrogenase electron transfer subunit